MHMKEFILKLTHPVLGRKKFQKIFEKLHFWVLHAQNYGQSSFIKNSGEVLLLYLINKFYAGKSKLIIFDVGANIGEYSLEVLREFSHQTTLYSFEPSKPTYEKLALNLSSYKNAICHNVGLGKYDGEFVLYSNNHSSGQSSLYRRNMDHWSIDSSLKKEEKVAIVNPIEFCRINNIEHIHFIKLDVEGNELNILQSMETMITLQKIDFIQFEFGVCNVESKAFFKDFYSLLNPYFLIFRIVKDGLHPILKYHEIHEVFITVNYLAVSKKISKDFNQKI